MAGKYRFAKSELMFVCCRAQKSMHIGTIKAGMISSLQPGLYVAAISGGVDSVALLDMLHKYPDVKVVVAHYDHGIRPDSAEDKRHVEQLAKHYKMPFVFDEGRLGANTSEAAARKARYDFLRSVQRKTGAQAILTAHHQDDLVETALLNLLRGTHRKGLSSLKSIDGIRRPLLHAPKKKLVSYARANGLVWREDSTNQDLRYKRNLVRHTLVNKLTPQQRRHLVSHLKKMHVLNDDIDALLANMLHVQPAVDVLDRGYMTRLPFGVARELMAAWLRRAGVRDFDRPGLQRMTIAAKTYMPGRRIDVDYRYYIDVNPRSLALVPRGR